MKLIRGISALVNSKRPTIVSIGSFDGVHLGHRTMISHMLALAAEHQLHPTLITFEPTPKEFFMGSEAPARLSTLREKIRCLQVLGIDQLVCLRFDQTLADMPAEHFIRQILVDGLELKHLIVGDDFRFGKNRQGDSVLLAEKGREHNFVVQDTDTIRHESDRISSTRIREALAQNQFRLVEQLLGRPYEMSGRVCHGDKRGRSIGFPTANILLGERKSPLHGVFIVKAFSGQKQWAGMANIGKRPTVAGQQNRIEAHLFDCDEDLYSQRLRIQFLEKIRDEEKFDSIEALKEQIHLDKIAAQNYFGL